MVYYSNKAISQKKSIKKNNDLWRRVGQNKHTLEEHQALWLNGLVLNLILKHRRFEPHQMQGVLALSRTLYHLFSTGSTEESSQQDRKNLIKQNFLFA